VTGTPFDFRTPTAIGAHRRARLDRYTRCGSEKAMTTIRVVGPQGRNAGLAHAVRVADTVSRRTLDITTTEPGLQSRRYSRQLSRRSWRFTARAGSPACIVAQLCSRRSTIRTHPTRKHFRRAHILRPGETMRSRSVFTFGVARWRIRPRER
jgi:aldose 1-epimerase